MTLEELFGTIQRVDKRLERIEKMLSEQRKKEQQNANKKNEDKDSWLTAEDVAKLTGYSLRYVRKLSEERKIPHYKIGKMLRFKKEEIEQFNKKNTTKVASDDEIDALAQSYFQQRRIYN